MANNQMKPLRVIVSRRLAGLVIGGCGIAFAILLLQELSVRRQATIDPGPGSHGPAVANPVPGGASPSAAGALPAIANSSNSLARGNPLWAIPLSSLTATRERPLFSPSRRGPAVIELASVPPPRPVISQPRRPLLALVGTIAGETQGFAIFFDDTTKGIVRLKTGEAHSGWTLRSVTKREATLQKDRETAILALPNRKQTGF
jgi:general secretion pathway protein N